MFCKSTQVVAPKKAKLAEAEITLAETTAVLNKKQAELQAAVDQLNELQANFDAATAKKAQLEYQVNI